MLRRFGWVLSCGISVIAAVLGRPALAAVPLEWEAPAECPRASEVQAWVDALVDSQAEGRAEGVVARAADGYRLALVVTTSLGRSERALEARQCEPLARAAAVVVAVAVDPLQARARSEVVPLPPVRATPPATARTRAPGGDREGNAERPVGAETARKGSRRPRAAKVGVEAGVGTGLLPRPHAILHAWSGLAWRRLEGQVTVTHRFGQLAEQPAGGGGLVSATTAGVALGPVVRYRRWGLHVMGMIEAGAMVGDGRGLRNPRTAVSPWVGVGLRPGIVWWPVAWLGLRADATLTGSLLQPQFEISGGPLIHRVSLLGARVGLGVEFRIPLDQSGRGRRPRG